MSAQERFFEHFMDPVDGVLCLPAASDAAAIEREASPHGLRFPLLLNRTSPLCAQVASSPFAPASSRYGPYCDNITGMNWELPDGRRVRVGERVVKSATGYDLLRFLLASGSRYGRALDYVLRLRPACDTSRVFCLRGDVAALRSALKTLLQSSWMHWLDSADLVAGDSPFLRVAVHCPAQEFEAYQNFLSAFSKKFSLALEPLADQAFDGCPDLVVKTTPEFVADTAFSLAKHPGAKCVALCSCGAVHVFLPDSAAIAEIVRPIESSLHAMGGHWQSRHVSPGPSPLEAAWISTLRKEWNLP
ncbi:MAG: hypothetical protein WCS31_15040 [Verrucomicrobiae bacterium]